MTITTVGLDLAKNVFQAHGVDERSKAGLRKQLKRGQMAEFFANLPPCLIGVEAKNARIVWALLANDREFRPDYTSAGAAA